MTTIGSNMLKKLYWKYFEWQHNYPCPGELHNYMEQSCGPPVIVETVATYIAYKGDLDETATYHNCSRERVKQRLLKFKRLNHA